MVLEGFSMCSYLAALGLQDMVLRRVLQATLNLKGEGYSTEFNVELYCLQYFLGENLLCNEGLMTKHIKNNIFAVFILLLPTSVEKAA